MAQFDVHKSPRGGVYPLVVDLQSDLHATLATRVVVPLVMRRKYGGPQVTRLTPSVNVGDDEYVAVFPLMAAVPTSALGAALTTIERQRAVLIAALDLLITGS
ncbi:hypothetical protein BH11MYX3_BH11MYX3_33300 [soil metagenome]